MTLSPASETVESVPSASRGASSIRRTVVRQGCAPGRTKRPSNAPQGHRRLARLRGGPQRCRVRQSEIPGPPNGVEHGRDPTPGTEGIEEPMDAMLTVGFVGFSMAAWTAIHLHLTARPPEPVAAAGQGPTSTPSSSASSIGSGAVTSVNQPAPQLSGANQVGEEDGGGGAAHGPGARPCSGRHSVGRPSELNGCRLARAPGGGRRSTAVPLGTFRTFRSDVAFALSPTGVRGGSRGSLVFVVRRNRRRKARVTVGDIFVSGRSIAAGQAPDAAHDEPPPLPASGRPSDRPCLMYVAVT